MATESIVPASAEADDLEIPFIFVPHGAAEPAEWMAAHPGWVRIPAVFVPHGSRGMRDVDSTVPVVPVAAVSGLAEAGPLLGRGGVGGLELGAEVGLGVVAGAAAAVLAGLWPARTAGPEMDAYHGRRATGAGDAPTEGYSALPPPPPHPGLVPPFAPIARPGDEGFSIGPPLPPLPGSLAMPPLAHVLPGADAQPQGPTIDERNRNEGLPTALRSYAWRAREAAQRADPAVTQALKGGEWWAHHLINIGNIRKFRDIFDAAAKAGWRTDDVGNVMPLPTTPEAQQKLKELGIDRPAHRGGHPVWNEKVFEELKFIETELDISSEAKGSDSYDKKARRFLNDLQDRLRREMLQKLKISSLPTDRSESYV